MKKGKKNLIIINFFSSFKNTTTKNCGNGMKCSTTKIFFKEVRKIFNVTSLNILTNQN